MLTGQVTSRIKRIVACENCVTGRSAVTQAAQPVAEAPYITLRQTAHAYAAEHLLAAKESHAAS